jgi:osmoprotectant transport system ATP-binding protein
MIEFKNVSKSYGETVAVESTDLQIPTGETTVLIGPSGCGKSTTLRLMLGLIEPTTGDVFIDDDKLTPDNAREIRHRMGYVIQHGGLFPHLTARENTVLMAEQLGWSTDWIEERLNTLTTKAQFPEGRLEHYPGELSGGQKQRVGIMRAMMLEPDFLLMDEPLGALDPMIRANLQDDLRELFRTLEKTVVIVTHDMNEAAYFGHNIVLMRDGRIVQVGSLEELLEEPNEPFVTEFINAQRSELDAITDKVNG